MLIISGDPISRNGPKHHSGKERRPESLINPKISEPSSCLSKNFRREIKSFFNSFLKCREVEPCIPQVIPTDDFSGITGGKGKLEVYPYAVG